MPETTTTSIVSLRFVLLDVHPLAAASRSILLETEPKFCGRYFFESVASQK